MQGATYLTLRVPAVSGTGFSGPSKHHPSPGRQVGLRWGGASGGHCACRYSTFLPRDPECRGARQAPLGAGAGLEGWGLLLLWWPEDTGDRSKNGLSGVTVAGGGRSPLSWLPAGMGTSGGQSESGEGVGRPTRGRGPAGVQVFNGSCLGGQWAALDVRLPEA